MDLTLASAADPVLAGFDDIIDVRAPAEYAEDHLPGAINLPVLSDAERARVGTIYKQVSPFDARKLGAALVAANAARHLQGPLADRGGAWQPLVYCWRGGQRSGSFGTILSQIGWRVARVQGGYKAWRSLVVDRVQNGPIAAPVIVLDGNTGSAKTAILQRLAQRGHQVIDLEGLANHRGSLFGGHPEGQPSQKMFEGRLAVALERSGPRPPPAGRGREQPHRPDHRPQGDVAGDLRRAAPADAGAGRRAGGVHRRDLSRHGRRSRARRRDIDLMAPAPRRACRGLAAGAGPGPVAASVRRVAAGSLRPAL